MSQISTVSTVVKSISSDEHSRIVSDGKQTDNCNKFNTSLSMLPILVENKSVTNQLWNWRLWLRPCPVKGWLKSGETKWCNFYKDHQTKEAASLTLNDVRSKCTKIISKMMITWLLKSVLYVKKVTTQRVWSQKGYHNVKTSWKSRGKSSNMITLNQQVMMKAAKDYFGLHR